MKLNLSTKTKGLWSATGVVFTQGFEAVLLPFLLFASFMVSYHEKHGVVYASFVMSIKELISLIMIFAYIGSKTIKSAFKIMKDKRNIGFILSGVFGTGLGNIMFITGIVLAGPAYGVILSAFYPIFAILFNKIFFKEPDNWIVKIGVILTIIAGTLFIGLPIILSASPTIPYGKMYGGMFCGFGAGLFWALEGLLLKKSMEKNNKVTKQEIVVIRTFSVTMSVFLLFLPLSIGIDTAINQKFLNVFKDLYVSIFTNSQAWIVWLVLILAGLNIVILRIMHTTAIENIGQKLTAIIDTNNFIVPAVFAVVLSNIMRDSKTQEVFSHSQLNPPELWLIILPLSIGLLLVMLFHGAEDPPSPKDLWKKLKKSAKKQ